MQKDLESRQRRARWRAEHRGTKELDLLLGSFADANVATFVGRDLDRFEALLAIQEPQLQRWLLQSQLPDDVGPEFQTIVQAIRRFHGLDDGWDRTAE